MTPLDRGTEAVTRWVNTSGINISRVERDNLIEYIRQQIIEAEAPLMTAPNIVCDEMHTWIRVFNPINKCWYETSLIACEAAS